MITVTKKTSRHKEELTAQQIQRHDFLLSIIKDPSMVNDGEMVNEFIQRKAIERYMNEFSGVYEIIEIEESIDQLSDILYDLEKVFGRQKYTVDKSNEFCSFGLTEYTINYNIDAFNCDLIQSMQDYNITMYRWEVVYNVDKSSLIMVIRFEA